MKKIILRIVLVIFVIAIVGGVIGWQFLSKEHRESRNLSFNTTNFNNLTDGTYVGGYEGGMYKWRINEVQVTVTSGKVTHIKLLKDIMKQPSEATNKLYDEVIKSQSLQVDGISGATLDTKAYLKSVDNALVKAQKK